MALPGQRLAVASALFVVPFAHLGHWYVGVPVYLGPVVLVGAWLKWASWRQRRRERSGEKPRT